MFEYLLKVCKQKERLNGAFFVLYDFFIYFCLL